MREKWTEIKLNQFAFSGSEEIPGVVGLVPESERVFKYIKVGYDRFKDSEAKLLKNFAKMFKDQKVSGNITITSERQFCASCSGIIKQFREKFPDVKVDVVNGIGVGEKK